MSVIQWNDPARAGAGGCRPRSGWLNRGRGPVGPCGLAAEGGPGPPLVPGPPAQARPARFRGLFRGQFGGLFRGPIKSDHPARGPAPAQCRFPVIAVPQDYIRISTLHVIHSAAWSIRGGLPWGDRWCVPWGDQTAPPGAVIAAGRCVPPVFLASQDHAPFSRWRVVLWCAGRTRAVESGGYSMGYTGAYSVGRSSCPTLLGLYRRSARLPAAQDIADVPSISHIRRPTRPGRHLLPDVFCPRSVRAPRPGRS